MAKLEARRRGPHRTRPTDRRSTFLFEEMTWTRAEVEEARREVHHPVLMHRLGQGGPQSGRSG